MNKQKLREIIDSHRKLFRIAFGVVNRSPLNNSCHGGVKPDIGLSLLRKCKIVNRGMNNRIIIGDYSRLFDCSINIFGSNNTIYIGDHCVCNHASFWIEDDNNSIRLGEHTALCGAIQLATIEGTKIEIGKDCLLSSKIDIRTGDSHSLIQKGTRKRLNPSVSVKIGDHVGLEQALRYSKEPQLLRTVWLEQHLFYVNSIQIRTVSLRVFRLRK